MKELRKDLWILKMTGLKPNYSALSRKHSVSRNTVRKYDSGYQGKARTRKKVSRPGWEKVRKLKKKIKIYI